MHGEALGEQVGGQLVARVVGEREDAARRSRHGFVPGDEASDPISSAFGGVSGTSSIELSLPNCA